MYKLNSVQTTEHIHGASMIHEQQPSGHLIMRLSPHLSLYYQGEAKMNTTEQIVAMLASQPHPAPIALRLAVTLQAPYSLKNPYTLVQHQARKSTKSAPDNRGQNPACPASSVCHTLEQLDKQQLCEQFLFANCKRHIAETEAGNKHSKIE